MSRNLDLTTLRAFVAVSDVGGVTRAARSLNLTQSAVSMQLKRLEDGLGVDLLDRSGRGVALTATGEQLLGYARRMLALNDEIHGRLTGRAYEGEVVLAVPGDVVYPAIPKVLQRFAVDYPRVKVQLLTSFTRLLKERYARGEVDVLLTTEDTVGSEGETLVSRPLIWLGAHDGQAWKARPLRLAFEDDCIFRLGVQRRLDEAGIPWEMAVTSNSPRTIEATVSADLAVHSMVEGSEPPQLERIDHGGALPELRMVNINLYYSAEGGQGRGEGPVVADLVHLIRQVYRAG